MQQTNDMLTRLVAQRAKATPEEVMHLRQLAAQADFCRDLLEVDEPLWGGFWHFDVISPGYRLPAVELNLLRAGRLDRSWPEGTTVEQYLAELRQAILQPEVGLWTLPVAGEPCAVIACQQGSGNPKSKISPEARRQRHVSERNPKSKIQNPKSIVVWYCGTTGQLHAGYRVAHFAGERLAGAVEQRRLEAAPGGLSREKPPDWLRQALAEKDEAEPHGLAAKLDAEILRLRQRMA